MVDPNRSKPTIWIGFISKKTGFGLLDCKPTSLGLDFGLEGFQMDSNRFNPKFTLSYVHKGNVHLHTQQHISYYKNKNTNLIFQHSLLPSPPPPVLPNSYHSQLSQSQSLILKSPEVCFDFIFLAKILFHFSQKLKWILV